MELNNKLLEILKRDDVIKCPDCGWPLHYNSVPCYTARIYDENGLVVECDPDIYVLICGNPDCDFQYVGFEEF